MPVVIKNPQGDVSAGYNTLAGLAALVGAIQNLQESGRAREQESLKLLLAQNAGSLEQVAPGDLQRPGFLDRLFGAQPTALGQPVIQVGSQSLAYRPYPTLTGPNLVAMGLTTPPSRPSPTGETTTTAEPLASLLGQRLGPKERLLFLQEALKRRRTAAQQRPRGVPAAPSAVLPPHEASPSLPTLGETYPPSQADRLMQRRVAHRPEAATVSMPHFGPILTGDYQVIERHLDALRAQPATLQNRREFPQLQRQLYEEARSRYMTLRTHTSMLCGNSRISEICGRSALAPRRLRGHAARASGS